MCKASEKALTSGARKDRKSRKRITAEAKEAGYAVQRNGRSQVATACRCGERLVSYIKEVKDGIHGIYACTCGIRFHGLIASKIR